MDNERKVVIKELHKLAEEVKELKQEHRQKRPIVIEFSGSPKAGKTSCINSLELFLKRNDFSVKIVREQASVCPVSDKQSPMFNLWTASMSMAQLIGTLEDKKNEVDVLILDRGIFDSLCWFQWLVYNKKMEEDQRKTTEQFLLMEELVKNVDIVFAFCATPEVSIEREYATLLTDKGGSIMNKKVLGEYLDAIEYTIAEKKGFFHKVFKIETSSKNQDEVGKEVTEITLETLKELLMERIGYFEKNDELSSILESNKVFKMQELVNVLPQLKFDLRNKVEDNVNFLQPIPVAIITNKEKNKILVIKKNKKSASSESPERDKLLLYIGGHSRDEDATEKTFQNFLAICRSTLKREIKEEIGISIALNHIEPFYIYSRNNKTSKKHLAVCFMVSIDEEGIKLCLDPHELILNKGKSRSGKFLKIEEIERETELEEWSEIILEYCFSVHHNSTKQLTLFDYQ